MRRFIEQFIDALKAYVEPYVTLPVFVDREGLAGGDLYEKRFSEVMPRSVCLIAVYTPTYFDPERPFCAREYRGMEIIERQRLETLGDTDTAQFGMIIPIILKGVPPPYVADCRDCRYDFSRFNLRSDDLSSHELYADWFEQIAQRVRMLYDCLRGAPVDPLAACGSFRLPSEEDVQPLLSLATPQPIGFPGRVPLPAGARW